jgi:phosphatidylserine/phosphatidylglycerophosphate/cardiolipin synthase-like enzyme
MTVFEDIDQVIHTHLPELQKPGALSVRPGYQFTNGWITGQAAIIVTVDKKKTHIAAADRLPVSLGGFPVDVEQATPLQAQRLTRPAKFFVDAARVAPEQRPAAPPMERTMSGASIPAPPRRLLPDSAQPEIAYTPAPGVALAPVTATVTVQCFASPDQGWPHLEAFLNATRHTLTVGMYDFTSKHILDTANQALAGKHVNLVLDHPPTNPTAEQSDEQTANSLTANIGSNLSFAWALDNHNTLSDAWIYPSAYHIKVAARDSRSVWLSSGNWNNSNEDIIDPAANPADANTARSRDRDWHVIIDHPGLAATFEAYLKHDLDVARPHSQPTPAHPKPLPAPGRRATKTAPFARFFPAQSFTASMTITPLLTPDLGVYVDAVTDLIRNADHTLYLQYQYIQPNFTAPQPFQDLIAAVVARHHAGVDVKIIASEFQTREHLEELQNLGFDVVTRVKIQANVHNKGIVADGQRVLVSSQNWSKAGVLENRDAGVIIDHAPIAAYYEQIFLHDWNTLGQFKLPGA